MHAKTQPAISAIPRVIAQSSRIILGKERQIRLALACIMARGHLLIEDVPGVGKTTLAHVLAKSLGLDFHRIQFTSDMLPADIIGVSIFDRKAEAFRFHPGPVFAQLILADEVNRATPKTQSALLEAMEEHQVTAEGETRPLPEPFFVIATQNPSNQVGTFPLPESQLDRFLMRIELGYPDRAAERQLLQGVDRRDLIAALDTCLAAGELEELQSSVDQVHAAPAILDYIQALVEFTRRCTAPGFRRARLSPCCIQRAPGRYWKAATACCPRTCRPSCRALPATACTRRATARRATRRSWSRHWRARCPFPDCGLD
jgi:MoxR-like ATPase